MTKTEYWTDFRKWWRSYEPSLDSNRVDQQLLQDHPLFSQMMNLSKSVLCILDIKKMQYLYLSSNVEQLSGYAHSKYINGGVEFAFKSIPPDEHFGITEFVRMENAYFASLPAPEKSNYRGYWDYSVTGPLGNVRIMHQDYALKYDDNGINVLMVVCIDVTNLKGRRDLHFRMTNGIDNFVYEFNVAAQKVNQVTTLTAREMEVAKLVYRSLESKAIADTLGLSVHTVNTHRRHMIEKFNAKDTQELMNLLRLLGFL